MIVATCIQQTTHTTTLFSTFQSHGITWTHVEQHLHYTICHTLYEILRNALIQMNHEITYLRQEYSQQTIATATVAQIISKFYTG